VFSLTLTSTSRLARLVLTLDSFSVTKRCAPTSLQTIIDLLKEIQDKLEEIESTIKAPNKAAKPEDWWKVEYIDECKGYRGVTLLMALGNSGGFDSVEQWRNACRTKPPSQIPRSTFFVLRNELRSLGLINADKRTLTAKGEKAVERMIEFPFPITNKKQLLGITESL
jgi:hypothetical protein